VEFRNGALVVTADGQDVGRVDRVVLNPQTRQITHIVVRQGLLFSEDKLVPIGLVASATEDRVTLKAAADRLGELELFEETHYAPLSDEERALAGYSGSAYPPPLYYYPPALLTGIAYPADVAIPPPAGEAKVIGTERNTPVDTIALQEGARILNVNDEEVGTVERVISNDHTRQITHLVLAQGLIFRHRRLIPIAWVQIIHEDVVRLNVSTHMVDSLPDYEG
jgi:uncharacterized protein YrrD